MPPTLSAPGNGPYSRTISAVLVRASRWVLALLIYWLLLARKGAPQKPIYAGGSEGGSNKFVVNPASGGASQRRARARPMERTRPADSRSAIARCTVRWLAPRASASAEVDHAAPSESSATRDAWSPSMGGASTTTSRPARG